MLVKRLSNHVVKLLRRKRSNISVQRQEEIVHLQQQLQEFGIGFSNLADRPQGIETHQLMEISQTVARQTELLHILSSESEPATREWLSELTGISPQILKEYRTFIVTMAHIFAGPYPCLREYLRSSMA